MKQIFTQRGWLKYTTVMLRTESLRESIDKTLCMFASTEPDPSDAGAYVSEGKL